MGAIFFREAGACLAGISISNYSRDLCIHFCDGLGYVDLSSPSKVMMESLLVSFLNTNFFVTFYLVCLITSSILRLYGGSWDLFSGINLFKRVSSSCVILVVIAGLAIDIPIDIFHFSFASVQTFVFSLLWTG